MPTPTVGSLAGGILKNNLKLRAKEALECQESPLSIQNSLLTVARLPDTDEQALPDTGRRTLRTPVGPIGNAAGEYVLYALCRAFSTRCTRRSLRPMSGVSIGRTSHGEENVVLYV